MIDSPKEATSTLTASRSRELHRNALNLRTARSRPGRSLFRSLLSCDPAAASELSAFDPRHRTGEDPANTLCCSDARNNFCSWPPKPRIFAGCVIRRQHRTHMSCTVKSRNPTLLPFSRETFASKQMIKAPVLDPKTMPHCWPFSTERATSKRRREGIMRMWRMSIAVTTPHYFLDFL